MRASGRRHSGPLLGVLLLGALLLVAVTAYKYVRLRPRLDALLARARALQSLARDSSAGIGDAQRLGELRAQLGEARQDLEAVRRELMPLPWLAEHLGWVPVFGPDLAAVPPLLDTGTALCDAGWWGLLGLEPVVDAMSPQRAAPGQTALEAALPALAVARPRFAEAEKAVARARAARERIDARRLSPRLARVVARLDRYLPALEAGVQLAQRAPELLGQERPVTYLILAQNNHELRPTGGFISGLGVIELSQGKIITSTFQDSYQVDAGCDLLAHPPAPAPLRRYMWAPVLMFRDANWSPDFPTSAAVAESIYRLCRNPQVDGVIAIDLSAVGALLGALGPLQPGGYPSPVSSETLLQYVGQYWTAPLRSESIGEGENNWWAHRKDFMADLLQAALQRVTSSPQAVEPRQLAMALLECLQGRHLLIYLRDPAARALAAVGWDGAVRPSGSDYLMVVDSNVGFRKVNPNVGQSIDYQVRAVPGQPASATLTVRYTNASRGSPPCVAGARYDGSYEEMMQGCYWDYVRVYVPLGSRLLGEAGADSPPEVSLEAGKAVFAALLVVAPGQSRELVFDYELPAAVVAGAPPRYHLLVQKQPGSSDLPVQVAVSGADWQPGSSLLPAMVDSAVSRAHFELAADTQLEWVDASGGNSAWPWAVLAGCGMAMVLAGVAMRPHAQRIGASPSRPQGKPQGPSADPHGESGG